MTRRLIDHYDNGKNSNGRNRNPKRFQRLDEIIPEQRDLQEEVGENNVDVSDDKSDTSDYLHEQATNINVLDCNFCGQHLSVPFFQCVTGHILCASCNSKDNMCVICNVSTIDCHDMEKLQRRVKIACDYVQYGCKEVLKHSEKNAHENSCVFSPCICPQKGCNFIGNSKVLGEHFKTNHELIVPPFTYDEVFFASIHFHDKNIILQGKSNGALFVITNKTFYIMKKLNVYHIGAEPKPEYSFEILACSPEADSDNIRLKAQIINIQNFAYLPSSNSLFVPYDYFKPCGRLSMKIRITRIGDVDSRDNP